MTNHQDNLDRLPPHSIDAEMALLGSLAICDGDDVIFTTTAGIVSQGDFFLTDNQVIFASLMAMHATGVKIDAVTLIEDLEGRNMFDQIGGRAYISKILNSVPSAAHFRDYAEIIRENSKLRAMIESGHRLIREGYAAVRNVAASDLIGQEVKRLSDVLLRGHSNRSRHIGEVMIEVYEQLQNGSVPMVPTGFPSLDSQIGGIALGEMLVIAARPSMGKSLLAKQIAVQVAAAGFPVGLVSLEEGELKIGRNLLANETEIDNHRLRTGSIAETEWAAITAGVSQISALPFHVTQKARRMVDIKAQVCSWIAQHGVKLVIIDYIQRIGGVAGSSAYETVSNISIEVSDLAKSQNVAIIAIAQLNRGPENREDTRPTMADLRGSGQIEQDADGIIFIHRPDYYRNGDVGYIPTRKVELIIAKWRDGVRGNVITLQSSLSKQRFIDPNNPAHYEHPEL